MSLNRYIQYLHHYRKKLASLDNGDPRAIAARTYGLSLSLSLGPSIVSFFARGHFSRKAYAKLSQLLKKELGINGFAFAMTVAVGGGATLDALWRKLLQDEAEEASGLWFKTVNLLKHCIKTALYRWPASPYRRAFICNALSALVAVELMQRGKRFSRAANQSSMIPLSVPVPSSDRRISRTLDLTLLLLVRALDSCMQGFIQRRPHSSNILYEEEGKQPSEIRKTVASMTDKLDAMLFWIASAR